MVKFVIGPSKINGRTNESAEKVRTSINKLGKSQIINIETGKFKMGNLDNMMQNYEVIQKVESQVESVLKKLTKSYLEVNPKANVMNLQVESRKSGPVSIEQFLQHFDWDDSKYPRNQNLTDLMKIISQRINTVDNNLRHRIQAFNSSREKVNNAARQQTSSALTRNLNEIFSTCKGMKNQWFVNTPYLKTMIAVVPKDTVENWKAGYEFLNDFVLPQSDFEFPITTDIGSYSLRRIIFLESETDHTVQEAKQKFGVTLREFEYNAEESRKAETQKKHAQAQSVNDQEMLSKACSESFKDIYSTYIHIKIMKVAVDSQMRYGSSEDYCIIIIDVKKGKENKCHDALINAFCEANKRDLYGTKDAIGDSEDFFPYAFAEISLPLK